MSEYELIPLDPFATILSYLDCPDLAAMSGVCTQWRNNVVGDFGKCRRVTVCRSVDDKNKEFMCAMLRVTDEATICEERWGHGELEAIFAENLCARLRFLYIEGVPLEPSLLSLLNSQCLALEVLNMSDEPLGSQPLFIQHDRLEYLQM